MPPPTPCTDSELVVAARAGDKGAFGEVLIRHRTVALALARRMLGDTGWASDAVQEATVVALVSLDRLRGERGAGESHHSPQ